jgi:rhodanese-related sulfurtransferase
MREELNLTPETLKAMLERGESVKVVDVREEWEYSRYRIPGSVSMPLSRFTSLFRTLHADEKIVMVCESGSRSEQAAQFLHYRGIKNALNLIDGMNGWIQAGYEVEQ